ncbi:MAG: biotin--[acetyl-CoA-carboxylase] ligase [Bacteroidales bacterium]|nr:biotin--[acetyl-CoA-carboxylase] ligase [Bacteroidales bacterium]MCF8458515.1 biotin--[acetyl-CoA-carboxylase] ligase [Bacteroidales bacterium]
MKNKCIGSSIISLNKIDSTNSYANQMSLEGKLVSGTVILARNQTRGKGQQGTKWESQEGKNLTFSILLFHDELPADQQFMLSKAISLGIIDYLVEYADGFSIKWPNDIYFENHKIAGILIENSVLGTRLSESVVGIGININQKYFSKEARNPISLYTITGKEFIISNELDKVLACLDFRYQQLSEKNYKLLDSDYLRLLYRIGKWNEFSTSEENFTGKIIGVTGFGQLQIEFKDGTVQAFGFKEVEFVI